MYFYLVIQLLKKNLNQVFVTIILNNYINRFLESQSIEHNQTLHYHQDLVNIVKYLLNKIIVPVLLVNNPKGDKRGEDTEIYSSQALFHP